MVTNVRCSCFLIQLIFIYSSYCIIFPGICKKKKRQVTHTCNLCSAFIPSKVRTHTAVNTHLEQRAAIYAAVPGEQLRVWCLAQAHLSRGSEGGECAVNSLPHLQFLPARDSNSQPFDYESDSLTIRP